MELHDSEIVRSGGKLQMNKCKFGVNKTVIKMNCHRTNLAKQNCSEDIATTICGVRKGLEARKKANELKCNFPKALDTANYLRVGPRMQVDACA